MPSPESPTKRIVTVSTCSTLPLAADACVDMSVLRLLGWGTSGGVGAPDAEKGCCVCRTAAGLVKGQPATSLRNDWRMMDSPCPLSTAEGVRSTRAGGQLFREDLARIEDPQGIEHGLEPPLEGDELPPLLVLEEVALR